jgi:outer membrane protein
VDYALQNNLTVRQSELTAQQQEATQRLNRAALLPTAGINGTQGFNFGTNRDPFTNQFQQLNVRTNNFTASGPGHAVFGLSAAQHREAGQLDAQAARVDIEQARNDLSLNVASSYLQLLLAQELIRASEARMSTVREQVIAQRKAAESRRRGRRQRARQPRPAGRRRAHPGDGPKPARPGPAHAGAAAQPGPGHGHQLPGGSAHAARPHGFCRTTTDGLDPNATFELARQNQPEIKAAELRVQSARRGIDIARGAYYPRLTVAGGVQTGFSSVRTQQVRTSAGVNRCRAAGRPERARGICTLALRHSHAQLLPSNRCPINSSTSFRRQPRRIPSVQPEYSHSERAAKPGGGAARPDKHPAAELRAEQTRLQLRQTIQQSYADALAAQRRYAASARQVEALDLAFRNAEIRFNNGLLNGTDFNIARNNLTAAESDMIQAKYEFIFRRKVLDFYQGKPLTL